MWFLACCLPFECQVRKELVTQRFHQDPATLPLVIAWNEEICRFMLINSHELVGQEGFSAMLNQEQMNKVCASLVCNHCCVALPAMLNQVRIMCRDVT